MVSGVPALEAHGVSSSAIKWTFYKDALALWRWRLTQADRGAESQEGFKHFLDCVKDAQANGYDPTEHALDVEQH